MEWFEKCYARLLIDNHITDDDQESMSRFDPAEYVSMVKRAGVDSAMVYACCHNGNCYYPTKVGHTHRGVGGRDVFGEIVRLLRESDIIPIAYYTVIFHNEAAKNHPDWRQEDFAGNQHRGRYWFACPNNLEYRRFSEGQLKEIAAYDVAGVFIDMTFWPIVCVCHNCRERYRLETGSEIPEVVDWADPDWVCFQRSREAWLAEFAHEMTACVKSVNSALTVNHQFSPVLHGWLLGQSPSVADACDYIGGDFYGGKLQHSFGAKVLAAFSKKLPYEFHTSRCVDLTDHTSMKSECEMLCSVATTLANGGAYLFIDAINPDGSLSSDVYDRLAAVSAKALPFRRKLEEHTPALLADVGLYFSMASHVDERDSGRSIRDMAKGTNNMTPTSELPPVLEAMGTARALTSEHIPYRVVSSARLDMSGLSTLIINNCAFMSDDEVAAIRKFVRDGGTLIATGRTSLRGLAGQSQGDFALADVFGVSYSGRSAGPISYLAYDGELDTPPTGQATGRAQFVLANTPAPLAVATTAQVLAEVCESVSDPASADAYASIHSNPPGKRNGFVGMSVNKFGAGNCVYIYSSLLSLPNHAQQAFGGRLLRRYTPPGCLVTTNAPACVELTVLRSSVRNAYLLCLVNYQQELPNVPVRDVSASLRLPGTAASALRTRVSDGAASPLSLEQGVVNIVVPVLETLEMIEIDLGEPIP